MSPKVSFLLTTYNFEKYVGAAIQSLLEQRGGYDFEIIVVDDSSTDNTVAIVKKFRDERIRFVQHAKNQGVAPTINEAFALAKGEYICRFDGDDEWLPDYLETVVPFLDNNPNIGFVYADIAMMDGGSRITEEKCGTEDLSGLDRRALLKSLLIDYKIPAPTIMARREAWAVALPLPDDLIYCDFDLALKVLSQFDLAYIDKPLAKYRVHAGNIHTVGMRQRKAEYSVWKTINHFLDNDTLLSEADKNDVKKARHLAFGDSYFGLGMLQDARRCYRKALKFSELLTTRGYGRRYFATFINRGMYENIKSIFRKKAAL